MKVFTSIEPENQIEDLILLVDIILFSTPFVSQLLTKSLLILLDKGLDLAPPVFPIVLLHDLVHQAFEVVFGQQLLLLLHFLVLAVSRSAKLHM